MLMWTEKYIWAGQYLLIKIDTALTKLLTLDGSNRKPTFFDDIQLKCLLTLMRSKKLFKTNLKLVYPIVN